MSGPGRAQDRPGRTRRTAKDTSEAEWRMPSGARDSGKIDGARRPAASAPTLALAGLTHLTDVTGKEG